MMQSGQPWGPVLEGALTARDIAGLVRGPRPTILDVGANDGTTTLRILRHVPDAVVHCFEPDPRALRAAREQLAGTSATLHPIALSDHDGEATFHQSGGSPPGRREPLPEGWTQSGSLREPLTHLQRWPWVTFEETIVVPTRSLDSWADEQGIEHVDLIWMDVQGAEDLVIQGARRLLERTDWLYTEYSDDEWYVGQRTLADLDALLPGWRVARRYSMDVLFERSGR